MLWARFKDGLQRGCVTQDQAMGGAWVLQRTWEGLNPLPLDPCAAWCPDSSRELVQPHGCVLRTMGRQRDGRVRDHQ